MRLPSAEVHRALLQTSIDEKSRRLIGMICEAMREKSGKPLPSRWILSDLYLRVRNRLLESPAADEDQLAEGLTLEIYLALLAGEEPPAPEFLVDLHGCIARGLKELGETRGG